MSENLVNISYADSIKFQVKIMMGAQYGRILATNSLQDIDKQKDEIIIACLRMGWNDAFRHVSRNVDNFEKD